MSEVEGSLRQQGTGHAHNRPRGGSLDVPLWAPVSDSTRNELDLNPGFPPNPCVSVGTPVLALGLGLLICNMGKWERGWVIHLPEVPIVREAVGKSDLRLPGFKYPL